MKPTLLYGKESYLHDDELCPISIRTITHLPHALLNIDTIFKETQNMHV